MLISLLAISGNRRLRIIWTWARQEVKNLSVRFYLLCLALHLGPSRSVTGSFLPLETCLKLVSELDHAPLNDRVNVVDGYVSFLSVVCL